MSGGLLPAYGDGGPRRFWELLAPGERERLRAAGTRHVHPAGSQLLWEGEPAGSVLILLAGRVKVIAEGRNGHPALLAIRQAGDIVGEMAAVDGGRRSASVITLSQVRVLRIPACDFLTALGPTGGVAQALVRVLTVRLRLANQRRVEHADVPVAARVALRIAELAHTYGTPVGDHIEIALPFGQDELAAMVSTSRETLVRVLRTLRAEGIIRTGRRRITVVRPEELARRSGLPGSS